MPVGLEPVSPGQPRQLRHHGFLDRTTDTRRSETMNDQQDSIAPAASSFDLADQLLHRLRNRLARMGDVDLPHDFTKRPWVEPGDRESRRGPFAGIDHQLAPAFWPQPPRSTPLFVRPHLSRLHLGRHNLTVSSGPVATLASLASRQDPPLTCSRPTSRLWFPNLRPGLSSHECQPVRHRHRAEHPSGLHDARQRRGLGGSRRTSR